MFYKVYSLIKGSWATWVLVKFEGNEGDHAAELGFRGTLPMKNSPSSYMSSYLDYEKTTK